MDSKENNTSDKKSLRPPVGKPPVNPKYPNRPFNYDEWMKSSKKMEEEVNGIPEAGDTIRTKKMQMEGKVEKVEKDPRGFISVFFRTFDGRLMRAPLDNVTVIEKLNDGDNMFENEINEITKEVLEKYNNYKLQETSDNFSVDDIKKLEVITDINQAKQMAKELISKKSKRQIRPDKVQFFFDKIDTMTKVIDVVKLMYDLLLAGEGQRVVGSRNSMSDNSYRRRFGEGSMGGINRVNDMSVSYEDVLNAEESCSKLEEIEDVDEVYLGPWQGDPEKYAKAPKSSTWGKKDIPLSDLVQDTINTHGVKWAFDYYVKKNGMPPRHFLIYSGLSRKFDVNEEKGPCWKNYKQIGMKVKGGKKVPNCVPVNENEITLEGDEFIGILYEEKLFEAEYQGRTVQLNKPMQGDVKKFKVYVKDPSTGNVKKVNFGDPDMKIRKSNPKARKSFRARHNCDNPGPKTKARFWSCKKW